MPPENPAPPAPATPAPEAPASAELPDNETLAFLTAAGVDVSGMRAAPETPVTAVAEPIAAGPEPIPEAPATPTKSPEVAALEVQVARLASLVEQRQAPQADPDTHRRLELARELEDMVRRGEGMAAIEKLGLNYDQVTREYASGKGTDPAQRLGAEIAKVRQDLEKQQAELRDRDYQAQLREEQARISQAVAAATDAPFVRAVGEDASRVVFQQMHEHYRTTGEILPVSSAMKRVEAQLDALVGRILAAPEARAKYAKLFTAAPAAPAAARPTLTNGDSQVRTVALDDKPFDFHTANDDAVLRYAISQTHGN